MTSAPGTQTPAENLATVLAAAAARESNDSAPNTNDPDDDMDAVAAEDDARRVTFDRILATSNEAWDLESDPDALRSALVTILNEVRGPALRTVEEMSPSAAGPARMASGVDDGVALDIVTEDMDADDSFASTRVDETTNEESFRERAKYIPLRLSQTERKMLRLVEGALNVSQYTDVVDVISYSRSKSNQRIHSQIVDLCSILSGLFVASDYNAGQQLLVGRDFASNEDFFQQAFEVARRHKIANPEKMRSTYGKLLFLLQDSASNEVSRMLDFSCFQPLLTVGSYLEKKNAIDVLDDPLVWTATQEIIPHGKTRSAIQRLIAEKERAVAVLARRYQSPKIAADDIRKCLYSIGDNNAFLRCNRDPCDDLLRLLVTYFGPSVQLNGADLSIRAGHQSARLTHNHNRQYQYCLQSLTLWREISQHMYKLWYMAESDMLDPENPYSLRNTGQGLNRVQAAPRTARVMYKIISTVQKRVGTWIGSSVVHLGDSMVPNSLVFIDKYAQLCRILLPLSTVIRRLKQIYSDDEHIAAYIDNSFGGVEMARRTILRDFFRFAFDGSGGSNNFEAGACIDGRLTSCWNWSSSVERKPYFPLFLLTGFTGFDGERFE
jgi:Protein of unknown function (DUF2009)